jgi:6-phosphogluconate dehydrogenase
MDIGIIGLGKMGNGITHRLLKAGHRVVAYNRTPEKAESLREYGAEVAPNLATVASLLKTPRTVWMYLPAGEVTREHVLQLAHLLSPGDRVLDGSNGFYAHSVALGQVLQTQGIHYLDVGTSGGLAGRESGYCLMVGGDQGIYQQLAPLWESVAQPEGVLWVGPVGAGHYVKMVHNAVEYGFMQALAESSALLSASPYGEAINTAAVHWLWQHGSIVQSRLGEMLAHLLHHDPYLITLEAEVKENGVGENGTARWAVYEAITREVAAPVLHAAVTARLASRQHDDFANRVLAALRKEFGGHNA